MNIEEAIGRYLSELERRNYAERTIREYGYDLNHLKRFLSEKIVLEVESITSLLLLEYQRWIFYQPTQHGAMRGAATLNKILAPVKELFRFLTIEGVFIKDPSADLEYGREPKRLPRNILTPKEAEKILESIDTQTALGYRDRTIMEIFYATGIRKTELRNLKVEDVNLEEQLLRINLGKGGKDRVVPLSGIACSFLENYIKAIRLDWVGSSAANRLFLSYLGLPLSSTALGEIVEKHAKRTGVKKHVTCHVWRHSCATHLLKNNANLRHVQEILGHRNLSTTEKYLSLTITDLKEAHRKYHPREQDRLKE